MVHNTTHALIIYIIINDDTPLYFPHSLSVFKPHILATETHPLID